MVENNIKSKKQRFKKKVLFNRTIIRTFLILSIILLEIGILVTIIVLAKFYNIAWLNNLYIVFEILSIIVAIPIINSRMDPSYKITWLFLMVINSVIGALLYLLFANKKFTKREKRLIAPSVKSLNEALNDTNSGGISFKTNPFVDGDLHNFAQYIRKYSFTEVFDNSKTTYFPWGEKAWPVMLEKLKTAKKYIFIEYFIIQPGKFWDSILEILLQKAKEGIDVRVIYDDLGCLTTLPQSYDVFLKNNGIKCCRYSKLKMIFSIRMNNRDHRKIMVIDGHIGFTGGINLADEYINEIERFGKWKDNAILIEGNAVFGLTNLFLSTWRMLNPTEPVPNFKEYYPSHLNPAVKNFKEHGYVSAYGSIPYTYETVGANIYEMMCYKAKRYIYIATPYLILNNEMEDAICQAAKSGVKVKLLTPHIPDKKKVFELTRANYRMLLRRGVEIYEYTPGFVHAKMFVVDGKMATVGTINLDFRSLFLHSENGCFLYKTDSIKDIEKDFEETFKVSQRITYEEYKKTPWNKRLLRFILKVFAPLM